jgi:hypothetical protein
MSFHFDRVVFVSTPPPPGWTTTVVLTGFIVLAITIQADGGMGMACLFNAGVVCLFDRHDLIGRSNWPSFKP